MTAAPWIRFDVVGDPKPQGSKRAFVQNGRAILTEQAGAPLRDWRRAMADAAREQVELIGDRAPLDGPLQLVATFRFAMPKSRPQVDHDLGRRWKDTRPDGDKLLRALCDALTAAGLIADDARFADKRVRKIEVSGDWTGVAVHLRELGPWPR